MSLVWTAFLDLRRYIFPGQRPFKFHYYNASSFVRPDRDWNEETKKRLRKCKHMLVSIDEPIEPVSQSEYIDLIRTFAGHMVRVLHQDSTFPIWFLSVSEPPMRATNCHPPMILPRTTDHPCNDVLKGLFIHDESSRTPVFPPNVHFLDNTDLSLPQFDENRADIIALIAYRIYVVVGKGVADWRAVGQRGDVKGLYRNGTLESNPSYLPYDGW
jgi:hypothetical protein